MFFCENFLVIHVNLHTMFFSTFYYYDEYTKYYFQFKNSTSKFNIPLQCVILWGKKVDSNRKLICNLWFHQTFHTHKKATVINLQLKQSSFFWMGYKLETDVPVTLSNPTELLRLQNLTQQFKYSSISGNNHVYPRPTWAILFALYSIPFQCVDWKFCWSACNMEHGG